jgi:hypothetical protein
VFGMRTRLIISIFQIPASYALMARPGDRLEV